MALILRVRNALDAPAPDIHLRLSLPPGVAVAGAQRWGTEVEWAVRPLGIQDASATEMHLEVRERETGGRSCLLK